ncbi:MAG: hypothetical protein HZB41_03590 [Ignavibacteriae bacterium]|nr:hypothetical protein [Ignavibacteriota bacterium]
MKSLQIISVSKMLIGVVDKGTGKSAQIEGYKVAGKTGTTQKLVNGSYETQSYYASFIGFFPADKPQIALLVLLDSPQGSYYGGAVAAPIFKDILMDWLSIYPIHPTERIRTDSLKSDSVYVPDFRGLFIKDANRIAQIQKVKLANTSDIEAIILFQNPKPGQKIHKWGKVEIKVFDKTKKSELPDVRGMTLRRALTIIHNAGYKTNVIGSGKVREQQWSKEGKITTCTLICN